MPEPGYKPSRAPEKKVPASEDARYRAIREAIQEEMDRPTVVEMPPENAEKTIGPGVANLLREKTIGPRVANVEEAGLEEAEVVPDDTPELPGYQPAGGHAYERQMAAQRAADQERERRRLAADTPNERLKTADLSHPAGRERIARDFVNGYLDVLGHDDKEIAAALGIPPAALGESGRGAIAKFVARENADVIKQAAGLAQREMYPQAQIDRINQAIEKYVKTMLRH